MDYEAKAKELLDGLGELKGKIKAVKSLKDAAEAIPDVVKLVEAVGQDEGLKGADKKALAVAVLNALIDIPFLPESIEGMLIGWAIDAVVAALNKLVGKDWLGKILPASA
ncbi:MAG: hypothetical protein WC421_07530 [Elusimicrobiales bacterium]